MFKKIALAIFTLSLLAGCASVPMETKDKSDMAKKFSPPASDKAGVYVFRSGGFGGALTKDIWIDNVCLGSSAPNVFFYQEVNGNAEHEIATASEFSPNSLMLKTESGKTYFVRQYIKMGVLAGGADLELVDTAKGKAEVSQLDLAKAGICSKYVP